MLIQSFFGFGQGLQLHPLPLKKEGKRTAPAHNYEDSRDLLLLFS